MPTEFCCVRFFDWAMNGQGIPICDERTIQLLSNGNELKFCPFCGAKLEFRIAEKKGERETSKVCYRDK